MNKYEDHWREKMNDPETQKDFLEKKVKADMWDKIQASKKGFEQAWQKNVDNVDSWEGTLAEERRQAMWDKLQAPLAQFEKQWHEKIGNTDQLNGIFLDETTKERIAATIFAEKENFETEWQDKMNDPAQTDEYILSPVSKDRIWSNIQSGNITKTDAGPKEKRRSFFALRWSHAAALLIGAFSTLLVWDRTSPPLQNALVTAPPLEEMITPAAEKETMLPVQQEPTDVAQDAPHKHATKVIAKSKSKIAVKENRNVIERVAGKVTPVKPVQSGIVKANTKPVINLNTNSTAEDKANIGLTSEKDIATTIVKAPAKKVVHISDIRPAEVHTKGTSIYGRAFGEGKEKSKEKSTMTLNSVLKNYR